MDQNELRKNFLRLSYSETIEDSVEMMDLYASFFLIVISTHHNLPNKTIEEKQAKIVLQMMLTKALHLKKMLEGVSFKSKAGVILQTIIDPTVLASIIRNTYETTATFNIVYRANIDEGSSIVHKLWTIAGLKYRQRFSEQATTDENRRKLVDEQRQIEELTSEIKTSPLYQGLDSTERARIDKQIKDKSYLVVISNAKVKELHWQEVSKIMGVLEGRFENMYTYFSLYAHPSNIAVWQFSDMFGKADKQFLSLTAFNLQYFFMCMSIFTADYINLFPEIGKLYDKLPLLDQIAINSFNVFARGNNYSINDAWKHLG